MSAHRFGVVALVGAPNVGKSTLLNTLVGQKIAIVAPKPQTTRLAMRGVLTRPDWQAVLVDTPGLMQPANLLEEGMRKASLDTLKDADLVLFLASCDVEAARSLPAGLPFAPGKTTLVLNKIDSAQPDELKALRQGLEAALKPALVLEISARKKVGLKELEEHLAARLPEGPAHYPEDEITDANLRDLAAEVVREKVLLFTSEEVPHAVAVAVEEYRERENGVHAITCTVYVERDSQKGIVIGKQGSMLKKIGSAARVELENLAGAKVFLTLWVKVAKGWKKDAAFLKRLQNNLGGSQ